MERAELRWITPDEVANLASHRVLGPAWHALREQLDCELVLVVDAANVVGSRPDGWWRDRRGAAERLLGKLAALARSGVPGAEVGLTGGREWTWWPRIVVVVEGQAKSVDPVDGVEVVAAETDGDSEIVKVVADIRARRPDDHVVVITADRKLRSRVEAAGVTIAGPGVLLKLLDGP